MAEQWDKQPGEGREAFEAFVVARDTGMSTAQVAREVGKGKELIQRWSRQHRWQERIAAWQQAKDQAATRKHLAVIAETEAERLEQLRDMNARHAALAMTMLGKLQARLKTLDISTMRVRDLAKWAEVVMKMERLARGMPSDATALVGSDGGAIKLEREARERVASIVGEIVDRGAAKPVVGKPN